MAKQKLKVIKILIASSSSRSLMEGARRRGGLLSPRSQETRPGKRISDFRQKEQTGFQIEKAEQCAALEAQTPGAAFQEPERLISLILYGTKWRTWEIHVEHEVSSAVLSHCVPLFRKGWISCRWWRRKRFFIKLYLITVIWNKCGWTDWSFQATVTGPHLWDNIQTAISPGALL